MCCMTPGSVSTDGTMTVIIIATVTANTFTKETTTLSLYIY